MYVMNIRVGRWHLPAVFATGICHRYLPVNTGMDNTPKSGTYRHLLAFINIPLISLQITLLTVLATYYNIHGHHSTICIVDVSGYIVEFSNL